LLGQSRVFFAMSCDGLVPKVFSETHPRFGTPYKSNLIFFLFVGAFGLLVTLVWLYVEILNLLSKLTRR